jgi:hypothetical protein
MQPNPNLVRIAVLLLAALPGSAAAQTLDVCGCAGSAQSLGAFDSNNPATFPPGTTLNTATNPDTITIPLPPDGVLVLDSFTVSNSSSNADNAQVTFSRNAANTPVTLLVRGNVVVGAGDYVSVNGFAGGAGTGTTAGIGGAGGPGGYAGGDGAYQAVNQASVGGSGLGPGGGSGADASAFAGGGTFIGVPELRPLRGGSGGGGGRSTSASGDCSANGGGGGAGALLIAANGTIAVTGTIQANGGTPAYYPSNTSCATSGGGGSGGGIRLVANAIAGGGRIEALGGGGGWSSNAGLNGTIRMESFTNTFGTNVAPVAARFPSPQPVVNPVNPTVRITRVQGADTPADPVGFLGQIDMIVSAPGPVQLDLATQDVPTGTDVLVTVKPKLGAAPVSQRITLASADCAGGACAFGATFDLIPGAYIAEARATFEVP